MRYRPEYDPRTIGANLKRLRLKNGYSVDDIRQYLRLGTVQTVYKYESGRGMPPVDTLFALMQLYNVYNIAELIVDLRLSFDPGIVANKQNPERFVYRIKRYSCLLK